MKRLMIAGLALALCACLPPTKPDGEPRMDEAQQIALGCSAAQVTAAVLDGVRPELVRKLTEAQLKALDVAKDSALTICADPPSTFAELKAKGFAEAMDVLQRELAAYLARKNAGP